MFAHVNIKRVFVKNFLNSLASGLDSSIQHDCGNHNDELDLNLDITLTLDDEESPSNLA